MWALNDYSDRMRKCLEPWYFQTLSALTVRRLRHEPPYCHIWGGAGNWQTHG